MASVWWTRTDRCALPARLLLDGISSQNVSQTVNGRGAARMTCQLRVLDSVKLALHPYQKTASFLACTRPPDFVASCFSFTGFSPDQVLHGVGHGCFQDSAVDPARAALPPKPGGPHTFGGLHHLQVFLPHHSEVHIISRAYSHVLQLTFTSFGGHTLSSRFPR